MLTTEIKICQTQIRKKNIRKIIYYKKTNLLNHLINCVEELDNVRFHK